MSVHRPLVWPAHAAAVALFAVACSKPAPLPSAPTLDGDPAPTPTATETATATASAPEPPPDAREAEAPPPDLLSREQVTAAGRSRTYGLRLPKNHDPRTPTPLVFVFHGDGEDGFSLYRYFKFQEASGDAAILVYPSGEGATWDLYTPADRNKDIAFVEAILTQLAGRVAVDRARVFASGWSNGGFFVNQLACRRSALLRGAASSSGGAPYEPESPNDKWPNGFQHCPNQAPVPYLAIHGLADGTVQPSGGEFSAAYWAYVNGCGGTRAVASAPCEAYSGCKPGKPTIYCPIQGMGHQIWPQAAKVQWDFFKAL
ncbi:MAG: hypothetical protein IPF92_25970 [Myxococcales bacterium]|nr:hypothetical protein [Myxococcales bacterium]MBL0194478.1 hypothetical protein [Myxococcales bacterium]